jgi:hypothetical protein
MRERMEVHRRNPVCANCHKIMDPIGLALENFDGAGQYRTTENGAPIDASGELDGIAFKDAAGLGQAMHDNPATVACLVGDVYRYATGRAVQTSEADYMAWLKTGFAADGYRVPDLLRRVALSDAFYRISTSAKADTVKEAAQ